MRKLTSLIFITLSSSMEIFAREVLGIVGKVTVITSVTILSKEEFAQVF